MRLAMRDAADAAAGHEAVIVSHQLPIWMARCDAEGRRLMHDPRKRECTLASITSFSYPGLPAHFGQLPGTCRGPAEAAPDQEVRCGGLGAREVSPRPASADHLGRHRLLGGAHGVAAASRATRRSTKNLTQIPPGQRELVPEVSGPELGSGEDTVQQGLSGPDRGGQRLGLVVSRRVARRLRHCRRPVRRRRRRRSSWASTSETSTRRRAGGLRPGEQDHLSEHLRPQRPDPARLRRRPAAERHPVDADPRLARAGWRCGSSARSPRSPWSP